MDIEKVKTTALEEIAKEEFRKAVDTYKQKLREHRSLWDRIFPFRIIFVRKENV